MADALHTPGVVTAAEARLDDAGLIAVQGPTALDARTGVLVGPGTTTLVTGTAATAPMQYSIAPHHWVTSRGVNSDGVYRGTNEAVQLVNTTAAPGSGSRIDVIYEKQGDATSTITPDGATAPVYGVVQGTSTTGTPTKPAIPVGAIELGTATVAAGATATNGSGVVITNTARQTTTRGGLVLCRTSSERLALTTFPTQQAVELDTVRRLWHDGTRWRYEGDRVTVANATERLALSAYAGLEVFETATGATGRYDGTRWLMWDAVPQAFTPTVSSGLVVGTGGTKSGWYMRRGKNLWTKFAIILGTGPTLGSGLYQVGVPTIDGSPATPVFALTSGNFTRNSQSWRDIDTGPGYICKGQTAAQTYLAQIVADPAVGLRTFVIDGSAVSGAIGEISSTFGWNGTDAAFLGSIEYRYIA